MINMEISTHVYYGTKVATYYLVIPRSILFFFREVYFWDVYQYNWVRSYCHPPIRKMKRIQKCCI